MKLKVVILDEVESLIIPSLHLKLKKQYKFKIKLNDYWINLHKN